MSLIVIWLTGPLIKIGYCSFVCGLTTCIKVDIGYMIKKPKTNEGGYKITKRLVWLGNHEKKISFLITKGLENLINCS